MGHLSLKRLSLIGWLWLVASLLLPAVANASVTAQVDRNTINEGDTFTLTLTVSNGNHDQPDLSPLHQDFDVLSTGQRSMIQIINGSISSNQSWTITLSPKRTGKVTIPSITVGKDASKALTVTVLPATASSGGRGNQTDVFLEVSVKPAHHSYVQQQLLYTVRLYYADTLSQGTLSEPSPDNAIVQKLGKDSHFSTMRGNRQYQVIERRYAIFPQQSGKLDIPAVVFDGQVQAPSSQTGNAFDSFFNNFNPPTRHVHLRSRKLDVLIASQPASYQGSNWLPAQQVSLTESWSPHNPQFRVGEPITRSIIIHAKGLSSSQLPDLQMPRQSGLKLYPDQAQTHDKADGDTLDARRTQKIAMIPTQAGDLTLPAIHLTWWDTKAHVQRTSSLPAETVHVLPAAGASNTTSAPAATTRPNTSTTPVKTKPTNMPATSKPVATNPGTYTPQGDRIWIFLTILFAMAWLITILLWWLRQKRAPSPTESPSVVETMHISQQQCVKQIRAACQHHKPHAVKTALLEWAKTRWPDATPLSLGTLAKQVHNNALAEELVELERNLYTNTASAWHADKLLNSFDAYIKKSNRPKPADNKTVLAPLYPHKEHATGRR